jgi:hypothetical protein
MVTNAPLCEANPSSPLFVSNTLGRSRPKFLRLKRILHRFSDSTWIQKNIRHYFFRALCGGLAAMEQRGRNFSTLEKMCLERAKLAEKEMKYWLAEAEEWRHLKNASSRLEDVSATQLDCFRELSIR